MKIMRTVGVVLLGVWLILTGIIPILHLSFTGLGTAMAALAIVAGTLLILGR